MGVEGEGREEDRRYHMLHPLKARLHLLHKNVKACKKEVKSIAGTAGNVRGVFCMRVHKACVHVHVYILCAFVCGPPPPWGTTTCT